MNPQEDGFIVAMDFCVFGRTFGAHGYLSNLVDAEAKAKD
jgi:hypothetical protein